MKEIVVILNHAAKSYEQEARDLMANIDYDKFYDELLELEKTTGVILSNSPSVQVGYNLTSDLPTEYHEKPVLSLDKTKEISVLEKWIGDKNGLLSWKLDGLTVGLTYMNGELVKAVTRGNGDIGEVITNNAKVFVNMPINIPYKENLVIRGEAIIRYSDFERINNGIKDEGAKYKNPRNLCSGSVRQLNNKITAERYVNFIAFSVVEAENVDFNNSKILQLNWLKGQGFDVVDYKEVNALTLKKSVIEFAKEVKKNDLPSDGLVLTFEDMAYGASLGSTAKFPKDSIAIKWHDTIKETKIRDIEWSVSRTGLINPVAVFDPIELEGTTVRRASVHNINIMEGLKLGIGDTVGVYKSNMITPQISENMTRSGTAKVPHNCPVCGVKTEIRQGTNAKFLFCTNKDCIAQHIKAFTHFLSRGAIDIDGLSKAMIGKLIDKGYIKLFADVFRLERYRDEILKMDGFGEKSFDKLIVFINKARKTRTARFLYGIGIPNIGWSHARLISKRFKYDWSSIENATYSELIEIDGIGEATAKAYVAFFKDKKNRVIIKDILTEITFEDIDAFNAQSALDKRDEFNPLR